MHPIERFAFLALGAIALSLGGCHRDAKPAGDVVAIVDGQDITSGMIVAEARARNVPLDGPNAPQARAALLGQIVDRTVLVADAKKQGLDRNPNVQAERLRADSTILAQAAIQPLLAAGGDPDDRAIAQFEAANPFMFADRQALHVDQIRYPTAATQLPKTGRDEMTDVVTQLTQLGVRFDRSETTIDSAAIPPSVVAAILKDKDHPVQIDNAGTTYFVALIDAKPNPAAKDVQRAVAIRQLQTRDTNARIAAQIAKLRKEAKITYQPGYGPAAPSHAR